MQIIDVQSNAKATVAAAGHEGEEDLEGMPVEALLGMDMAHPNVVQTYRHTSLPSMVSHFPDACVLSKFLHWCLQRPALRSEQCTDVFEGLHCPQRVDLPVPDRHWSGWLQYRPYG